MTPYGLVGGGLTTAPEPEGGTYAQDSETVSEVGGDLKVALPDGLDDARITVRCGEDTIPAP